MRLMIEGNAGYLARVLAALEAADLSVPNGPTTGTASSGTPAAGPTSIAPIPAAPVPMPPTTDPDDDDDTDDAPIGLASAASDRDASGLPWDERIHSKNKTRNADGSWRKQKGLDPATLASVEAQLRAATPQPAPMPTPVMPPPPPPPMPVAAEPAPIAPPPPVMPPVAAPPVPTMAPAMPAPPAIDPTPAPVAAAGPMDFSAFFQQLQVQMQRRDAAGNAVGPDAPYLAELTAKISGAWGVPLNAITDLMGNANAPAILEWAVQVMRSENRWA